MCAQYACTLGNTACRGRAPQSRMTVVLADKGAMYHSDNNDGNADSCDNCNRLAHDTRSRHAARKRWALLNKYVIGNEWQIPRGRWSEYAPGN